MANTTWNPSDLANVTLSGTNNLTISAASANGGVRTIQGWTTGKFYFEYTCTAITGANVIGVANAGAVLTAVAGSGVGGAVINISGQIAINNTTVLATLGTISNGTVVGIALDLINQQIWFRLGAAGNWNGSSGANPASNTGGFSIAPLVAAAQAIFGLFATVSAATPTITANFGDTAFTGTVPAGFTAGYPIKVGVNWCFGDSFDLYATPTDAISGYWDSGLGGSNWTLVPGRFAGSRALQENAGNAVYLVKSSGSNDAIHHIVFAFEQTQALSGTAVGMYLTIGDGATAQCSLVFRSDGAIVLTSGGPTGTALDTYTGAVSAQSTWFAFEVEVVIHNTTGSWTVRKNGNTSNDHLLSSLNTRGGTTNNYASRLSLGVGTGIVINQLFDDLLWRSDATSVPWVGDIRCYVRMPASDASVQFTKSSASTTTQITAISSSTTILNTTARYSLITAPFDGTVGTATVSLLTGYTGNMKCSIFAAPTSTTVGAILGSATPINNPATGSSTFTFPTPVTVSRGIQYWIGFMSDTSSGTFNTGSGVNGAQNATTYAAFPIASPTVTSGVSAIAGSLTIAISNNSALVNESQEDGTTSYVFDVNQGDTDLYTIAPLSATPASTIATTVRSFMQKSDAGSRSAAALLKSGATQVASPTLALATGWNWAWRTDQMDPATGAAWTAAAVNNVQIGQTVVT
jgi:hypothetical protein